MVTKVFIGCNIKYFSIKLLHIVTGSIYFLKKIVYPMCASNWFTALQYTISKAFPVRSKKACMVTNLNTPSHNIGENNYESSRAVHPLLKLCC